MVGSGEDLNCIWKWGKGLQKQSKRETLQGFGILRKRVRMRNDVMFQEQPFCVEHETDKAEKKTWNQRAGSPGYHSSGKGK